ncbi:MAG: hypothetical protein AB1499_17795, partial [Nitrospirota bacterium]
MKRVLMTVLSGLFVICLAGCGGGGVASSGSSKVTIAVGSTSQSAIYREESRTFFAKVTDFFKFLLPGEAAAASASIPSNVKTIIFTIQGPGMTTITREVDSSGRD